MVQKLNRLIGRADFRVLVFFAMLTVLVTIGWTFAQLADESNTVNSYEELVTEYLAYREVSYMLAVPSWYLLADQVEDIESTYGLAGFQNQPDWYFNFNVGDRYFTTNSPLAGLISHGTKLIIYEDMVSGELLVVRDTGTNFVEEIVFKSPEWQEMGKDDTPAYLLRELSKRRVVWHVTLKDAELADEEFAAMLAAQEEFEGGGMMMLMSGGSCSEIVFTGIEKQETNDVIDVSLCIPDGINNVDVFVSTNLMTDGYPWVMVATNLSVVTNSVVWSWTNVVETNVFLAAADSTMDSDGDGLTDGREFYLFGTDMNLWDTDGDSYSDGEELQWGTDPLDIQSMPRLGRGVVINEVLYNPTGTDAGNEWAELFNTNRVPVDLTDFTIQVGSNAFNNTYTFPTNTILNSGDFLLVGGSFVANADHVVELNMLNRGSSGPTAGIRLVSPSATSNQVVDALLYAPTNSFNLPTTGFGTDGFAPWAASGFSVVRIKVGYDTDHASDWTFTSSPTPTASGELLDIDGDGISNATEIAGYSTTYGFMYTDYNNADTDFDGFSDSEETTNSPPTHPLEFDTDGDAFPWTTNGFYYGSDGDEVHNHGTDPTNPDSDGDGLPDGWEVAMGYNPTNTANGTADADADFDGDGVSNIDEMNQNSNPTDSNDFISHDYRLVLYHFPKSGWQPGQDMGTKTWAGYRFDNVTKTTGVAFVIADGGHTAETFSVSWEEAVNTGETGGRTNIVWATLLPGTSPKMKITDGGTTWPNQNPAERGADLSVDVLKIGMITPAGDPVNSPVQSSDGQNEFTYSTASPGVLTMNLKARVTPNGIANQIKDQVHFTVDGIGSSTLTWDAANPSGKPTVSGDDLIATVTFTGLPANNSDFGSKKAAIYFSGIKQDEKDYEVFFPRDALNNPSGSDPNWLYYWSQVTSIANLVYAGSSGGSTMAEVRGMTQWSYSIAPDKTTLFIYDQTVTKARPYGVGEEMSGIDMFVGTAIHENQHVIQITNADALLSTSGSDSFRYGWSWNQSPHNHWHEGPDGQWGLAGVDDDGNGTVDDARALPAFEPGYGDDISLDHPSHIWWPASWPLPSPNNVWHPIESDAVNATDNTMNEHDYALQDWGNPGKQHETINRWDD